MRVSKLILPAAVTGTGAALSVARRCGPVGPLLFAGGAAWLLWSLLAPGAGSAGSSGSSAGSSGPRPKLPVPGRGLVLRLLDAGVFGEDGRLLVSLDGFTSVDDKARPASLESVRRAVAYLLERLPPGTEFEIHIDGTTRYGTYERFVEVLRENRVPFARGTADILKVKMPSGDSAAL